MFMRRTIIAGGLAALLAPLARAEHYLDDNEAARLIFPDADSFAPAPAELDKAAQKEIKSLSGMRVRDKSVTSLKALKDGKTAGWVYVDNVIGKHEFITYAAGIDASGAVRGIEVLEYRETWGWEIRNADWRNLFTGLTLKKPPKLGDTITNISGATLSCRNVSDGVRRLLATHAVLGR